MLFFGSPQVIAVILAVFRHHANGRARTSTSNNNIERMLDQEENPADVLRLSESDSSSAEAVQSQIRSGNMIQPKEAIPVLRQKRSHQGPCYTDQHQTVQLASGGLKTFPICRDVSPTGCGSSIENFGMRKCKGSDHETVSVRLPNGVNQLKAFPRKCSCAV